MKTMWTTPYDGCGKCLVATRRLSRKKDSTNSPEKQLGQIITAVSTIGGHLIAIADDMEVSGATDPLTRPGLGPWLRGEKGPYDGIAGIAVDRIGRNVRDVLNTADANHKAGRILVTADHVGIWDLDDPNQENELTFKALGAQMEHRNIKKRNQDETARARAAGQPKQKNSYGYRFVRKAPTSKVERVEIDPDAAKVIQNVARRILADTTGTITTFTEAARLNRAGVLSPADHRAVMYGREPKGHTWTATTLRTILISEAALGFLMHGGKPVIGANGRPTRLAPELWSRATHDALIKKLRPKSSPSRAPQGTRRLSGVVSCGQCGKRIGMMSKGRWGCTARVRGIKPSQHCKPAPTISMNILDTEVEAWFLRRYGSGQVMRREFDPGTGHASQIAELKATRLRLMNDSAAGLYKDEDGVEWYRQQYTSLTNEINELQKQPERPAGWHMVPTGQTVADMWNAASDDADRREILIEYNVRVALFPRSAEQRFIITGTDRHTAYPAVA
jgi:site-specific DNA recombinase